MPRSTAFRASRPAATITLGLEVLVQEVIAAIRTSPCPTSTRTGEGASAGIRSGVGRLLTISDSVHALVFRVRAPEIPAGSWLPPPG